MAVDSKILNSKYVISDEKGYRKGFGYKLRPDAPDSVKKEFAEFKAAHKAVNEMAKTRKK